MFLYAETTDLLRSIREADPQHHTMIASHKDHPERIRSTTPIVVPPHVSLRLTRLTIDACLRFDAPEEDSIFHDCLVTSETEGDLLEITPPAKGRLVFWNSVLSVPNGGLLDQASAQHGQIALYSGRLICKRSPIFSSVMSVVLASDDELDDAGETA